MSIDLKKFIGEDNRINDKKGNVIKTGKYINWCGSFGYVKEYKNDPPVFIHLGDFKLKDFHIINNGVDSREYEFIFGEDIVVRGSFDSVIEQLTPNIITKKHQLCKEFVSDIIARNSHRVRKEINGGYGTIDDIRSVEPTRKDLKLTQKYVINYMVNNFTPEMITAFKLLILMPFHWIIKNDVDATKKELIKGLSLFGKPDVAKTLVTLYTLNMFVKDKISLDSEAKIYDSIAGFRGALSRTLGITLIDEFNKLLNDHEIRDRLNDIINSIYTKIVTIQGVSGGGDITDDKFTGTPVFTSNVKPTWNNSNLKRLDVIEMRTVFDPIDRISINKGKRLMLMFGDIIAQTFKEHHDEIISCRDSLEASELLLSKIEGLDLTDIINCPDCRTTNLKNMPLSILVKKDLDKRNGHELDPYNQEIRYGDFNLPWFIKQTDTYIAVEENILYEYFRDLIGDQSIDVTQYLNNEILIDTGTFWIGGTSKKLKRIKVYDFEKWLGLYDSKTQPTYLVEPEIGELNHYEIDPRFRLGERWDPTI